MDREKNLKWFRDAKFGMMIHWGICSLLGAGEWVMYDRKIPVKEYEKLAGQFNPVQFDAEDWVRTAKEAGMRYLVITAKHHDGFSMFRTKVSDFNIVDATPFGRDPMKEICEACKKYGIRLGFYYSHVREWRHPLAQSFEPQGRPDRLGNYGNFWDYPDESKKDLQRYIDEFDIPQLKELLTQYGDILTIWFDTPSTIAPRQAEKIRDLVHSIQPGCLVNARLSFDIDVDYKCMGDNEVPACGMDEAWDTPVTSFNSWGYTRNAKFRKSKDFIRQLCDIASKGGNYLLNAGPDSLGVMAEETKTEFRKIGEWLKINGEAIYGSRPAGLKYHPKWGCVTKNGSLLYALVFDEAAETIRLTGLKNKVKGCTLLGGNSLVFRQNSEGNFSELTVEIGQNAADGVRGIRIECEGESEFTDRLIPGDDHSVELCSDYAIQHKDYPYSTLTLKNGATSRWMNEQDWIEWNFDTDASSQTYHISLVLQSGGFFGVEDFDHEADLLIDGKVIPVSFTKEAAGDPIDQRRYLSAGHIVLDEAGTHNLQLRPRKIVTENMGGIKLLSISLTPEK